MLAKMRSILFMDLKIPSFQKEEEIPLFEYGVTPEEVLANYISARDHGQPQKAYSYLSKKDRSRISFKYFMDHHQSDPFIADTVDAINKRVNSQRFDLIKENERAAIVNWVTKSPKLYCDLPLKESNSNVQEKIRSYDTIIQTITFRLVKEEAYWKVVFQQYDIHEK